MSIGEPDSSKLTKGLTGDTGDDQIEVVPRFSPYIPRLGRTVELYPRTNKENAVF